MTKPQSDGYSHARHIAMVQGSARAAGIKGAAFVVLAYMCSVADFGKPTVRVSKDTISDRTGYCLNAVKAALRALRAAGCIEPIACFEGGRGRATVYSLRAKGVKGARYEAPNDETGVKGASFFRKGGQFFPERGPENAPPSYVSPDDLPEGEGGAFRAGRTSGALDAGASPGPRPATDREAELRRFSRDVTEHGYAEARRMQLAREAAGRGELP